jgi:hypothetical protein
MTTTTETTREEGVVTGRDGLQYASLAHVLLGEPLENWRNLEVGRLTRQGKAEIAVAWAKWFDEGRAKGHLSEHGFYVAAKIRKEPAALPPADSQRDRPRRRQAPASTDPRLTSTSTSSDEPSDAPDPSRFSGTRDEQVARALKSPEATQSLPPLSKQQLGAQKEMASRVLSRRRLLPFVQRMNERYMPGWVHEDICRRLEKFSDDVAAGKSPRLMLLMPPRHGKSELASKNFPAWHLGRHPDHEFIACSYNLSLAMGFSRKVKQLIDDPSYQSVFEDARLDPSNQSTEEWAIAGHRGGYVAAGIGGPITGKGAHVLVIDDPVKNAEEADSADAREKIWEWYLSTAYTRLAPGGGVLVIQTWWHDDDLAGRLQLMMAESPDDPDVDQFEVIKYPAIAEQDEYLELEGGIFRHEAANDEKIPEGARLLRRKGEALHPARYDLAKLNKIRALNRKGGGADGRWWSPCTSRTRRPTTARTSSRSSFGAGRPRRARSATCSSPSTSPSARRSRTTTPWAPSACRTTTTCSTSRRCCASSPATPSSSLNLSWI